MLPGRRPPRKRLHWTTWQAILSSLFGLYPWVSRWQIVKDSKNACQLAVPPDWSLYGESHSAAVLHDASTALVVVTSQPGQAFAPLTEHLKSILNISKEKLREQCQPNFL